MARRDRRRAARQRHDAVCCDEDPLKASGLAPEPPPATRVDLAAAAKKPASADKRVFGLLFSARQAEDATFRWLPLLQRNGGDIGRLDAPEAVEAPDHWVSYIVSETTSPDVLTIDRSQCVDRSIAGNAGMAISEPRDTPRVHDDAECARGAALLPVNHENIRASAPGGWNRCVPAASKQPDLA